MVIVQSNRFASAFAMVGIMTGGWFAPAMAQTAIAQTATTSSSSASSASPILADQNRSTDGDLVAQFATPATTVVSNQRSLTVTGVGQGSVPADRAILQLFYYPITPVDLTVPSTVPAPIDASELQFIVNALTEIGVSASDINVYADPNSYGGARVQLTLAQPTTDRISQIIAQTNEVVAESERFSPSGNSVIYTIEQCSVPENAARQKALAEVQTRAADLATIAGVELGEILSLSEYSTWNYVVSTCPNAESVLATPFQYGGYAFDPTVEPTVSVTNQITATFAIED